MTYKLVKRQSDYFYDKKTWQLQNKKYPNLYKDIAFGERAEFFNKKKAEKYLKECNG